MITYLVDADHQEERYRASKEMVFAMNTNAEEYHGESHKYGWGPRRKDPKDAVIALLSLRGCYNIKVARQF